MKIILSNVLYIPTNLTDHLGIGSIAAYLRQAHYDVTLDCINLDEIESQQFLERYDGYDVCGFTLYSLNANLVYTIAEMLKEKYPALLVCVGGYLSTICYEQILRDCASIDFAVLGDGEANLLAVVRCIEEGDDLSDLPHIVTREDVIEKTPSVIDIKTLPHAARDNLTLSLTMGNTIAQVSGSRGCCAHCSFCSANCYAPKWRGRSVEDIYDEICNLHRTYGIRCFMFNDASLEDPGEMGRERLSRLCDLLLDTPEQFAFRCFFRSESFSSKDAGLIRKLRSAGFVQAFLGFEAGNEQDLKTYGKRSDVANNQEAMDLFTQCGVDVLIGFIMFNPYSDRETLRANYEFLARNSSCCYGNYVSKIELDFGTALYKKLMRDGLIKQSFDYTHPYEYEYRDVYVRAIDEWIKDLDGWDEVMMADSQFNASLQIVNNVKALCPLQSECDIRKFYHIRAQVAVLLADFFQWIFIEHDLSRAQGGWPRFRDEIMGRYEAGKRLSMRMLVNYKLLL